MQKAEQLRLNQEAEETAHREQEERDQLLKQAELDAKVAAERQQAEVLQRQNEAAVRRGKMKMAVLHPGRGVALAGTSVLVTSMVVWQWPQLSELVAGAEGSVVRTVVVELPERTEPVVTPVPVGSPVVESKPDKFALTLKTVPTDAKIKMPDILPRYSEGMLLVPDKYRVQVTAEGYEMTEIYVDLTESGENKTITLRKQGRLLFEPEMVSISGGTFQMGCVSGKGCDSDEKPVRDVTISAFEMGKYEVTFEQWDECVEKKGCQYKPEDRWGRGKQPVMNVNWNDAQEYVGWLSERAGKKYRLLTEAEWEYAARAGIKTPFSTGNCINTDQANYNGDYGWDTGGCPKAVNYRAQTVSVVSFAMNDFGLFNMHGNVWEWVQDCYHEYYNGAPKDGSAWESGCGDTVNRVLRGGSWSSLPEYLRSANRNGNLPGGRGAGVGFRVARTL